MSQELVRVEVGKQQVNVGRAYALAHGLKILANDPTHGADGRTRPATRADGRKRKLKTTVSKEAAKKAATTAKSGDNPSS